MEGAIVNSRHHHAGGAGGREDCWSEGATEMLIEAWGDRYLQLSRGNLRQKDWREVADAVNGRENGVKPRRTDVQCKNRIDTLKKKYKLEKAKAASSKWPFYHRLDHLIGANASIGSTKRNAQSLSVPRPTTVTFTVKSRAKLSSFQNPNPNLNPLVYSGGSSSKSRLNLSGSNNSSPDGGGGGGGAGRADNVLFVADGGVSRKHGMDYLDLSETDLSEETAYKELASAILRFGEIYERIESSKQQQLMELEKERMEFTKDLEFQRMNMYMEAQLELEKMKRSKKYAPPGAGEFLRL